MRRTQLGFAILFTICAPLFALLAVWGCIYWDTIWIIDFVPAVLYVRIAHDAVNRWMKGI